MFTGIVTDLGEVTSIIPRDDLVIEISCSDKGVIALGASVACNGVCLTVIEAFSGRFKVQASAETVARTTVGAWIKGTKVNLERSLKLGDELGGHLVYGHVDGIATVENIQPIGESQQMTFEIDPKLGRFVAAKGSIALDGVSLTVNTVKDLPKITQFAVNIIPYTAEQTSFHRLRSGDRVNVEIDMLARYLERLSQAISE